MRRVRGLFSKQLKNRSSKHLAWLPPFDDAMRSMSNSALEAMAKKEVGAAEKELQRRAKKREKKQNKLNK